MPIVKRHSCRYRATALDDFYCDETPGGRLLLQVTITHYVDRLPQTVHRAIPVKACPFCGYKPGDGK